MRSHPTACEEALVTRAIQSKLGNRICCEQVGQPQLITVHSRPQAKQTLGVPLVDVNYLLLTDPAFSNPGA